MIDNNLCFDIALYPYELVTYGETGQVCQNWMQYRLIKQYLEVLTQDQTLVIESGHPLGLFRSKPDAPRVIITNAMMVGLYDNQKDWHVAMQMGVANYGQMTAGGWMYIGPQGIVHGTFNTLLNAGRMKLGIPQNGDLRGHLFISSGLGGMSGAQTRIKQAVDCGYWNNFRYDPRLAAEGKNPFMLDSKAPTTSYRDFIMNEARYSSLTRSNPERADQLFAKAEHTAKDRYDYLSHLA